MRFYYFLECSARAPVAEYYERKSNSGNVDANDAGVGTETENDAAQTAEIRRLCGGGCKTWISTEVNLDVGMWARRVLPPPVLPSNWLLPIRLPSILGEAVIPSANEFIQEAVEKGRLANDAEWKVHLKSRKVIPIKPHSGASIEGGGLIIK